MRKKQDMDFSHVALAIKNSRHAWVFFVNVVEGILYVLGPGPIDMFISVNDCRMLNKFCEKFIDGSGYKLELSSKFLIVAVYNPEHLNGNIYFKNSKDYSIIYEFTEEETKWLKENL